jgi:predicted MFS family arabinose efflux permease
VRLLVEIALVALAALGVAVCLAVMPEPARRPARQAEALPAPRPEQLVRLERLVIGAEASALHAHAYLRPLLAEVAARRLAARGRTLAGMSDTAGAALLGDRLWELVRPGRPFPEDRHGPGVSGPELSAMLDVLERL